MSAQIVNQNRNTRCCGFCRVQGHTVNNCNNRRLIEFENLCLENWEISGGNTDDDFRIWLTRYYVNNRVLVRSYCIRYCEMRVRVEYLGYIEPIIIRIRELYESRQESATQPSVLSLENSQEELQNELNEILTEYQNSITNNIQNRNTRQDVINNIETDINLLRRSGVNNEDNIVIGVLLLDFLRRFSNTIRGNQELNRKFDIKRTITECSELNECECGICYDAKAKPEFIKYNCGHQFCKDCVKQSLQNIQGRELTCAFCRVEIKQMEISSLEISNEFNEIVSN